VFDGKHPERILKAVKQSTKI